MSACVVVKQGDVYRITAATYLGARASCANGPLWEVHAERLEDGGRVYWHSPDAPVVSCDATRRDSHGIIRRCQLDTGHDDDHESWASGPAVRAGIIWGAP